MLTWLGILSLSSGLAPAASDIHAAAAVVQRPIVGGFRAVGVDDEGVQAAAAFAARSVDGELGEVTSAERQVVAGTNYKLSFSTSDGRSYEAIVFRALDGSFRISQIDETGDHHGDIAQEQADRNESDE